MKNLERGWVKLFYEHVCLCSKLNYFLQKKIAFHGFLKPKKLIILSKQSIIMDFKILKKIDYNPLKIHFHGWMGHQN